MSKFKIPPKGELDHLTRRFGPSFNEAASKQNETSASETPNKTAADSDKLNDQTRNSAGTHTVTTDDPKLDPQTGREESNDQTMKRVNSPEIEGSSEVAGGGDVQLDKNLTRSGRAKVTSLRNAETARLEQDKAEVMIVGYAYAPISGASAQYDKLVNLYGERDALRAAVDAGLKALDRKLAAGEPVEPAMDFSSIKKRCKIQRSLSLETVARTRSYVDPLGVLSEFRFGKQLYKTALGLFLAENK